jgi:hypothetical protein
MQLIAIVVSRGWQQRATSKSPKPAMAMRPGTSIPRRWPDVGPTAQHRLQSLCALRHRHRRLAGKNDSVARQTQRPGCEFEPGAANRASPYARQVEPLLLGAANRVFVAGVGVAHHARYQLNPYSG